MRLLERETQLRALGVALQEAATGQGRIALVSGEAGVGKTALVEEFVRRHRQSARLLWGVCDASFTPRPLGPLSDFALDIGSDLLALLNSGANRQTIFAASFIELQNRSTIAVIEDVHWADEATLDWVKFLGRRIQRTPSMILLTYRTDELGTGHPLWLVLGDLPSAGTSRIHLSPLSRTAVRLLASEAGQEELADELFAATSGNPFFVTEALAGQGERVPQSIRDAVLARTGRLSAEALAALEAAAVIGARVEPWLLAVVLRGTSSTAVEECIAKGMLYTQGDLYAFRHELSRQAILDQISLDRRLALHGMVLAVLRASPVTANDVIRLANHAQGSGDAVAILEYAPAAARRASANSSHREAIALFELALPFADRLGPAGHAEMLGAYAGELWYATRLADSIRAHEMAIELWHGLGEHVLEGSSYAEIAQLSYGLGRNADAERASLRAIAILEALPASVELALAYKSQAYIRMEERDCIESVDWGRKAMALAERLGDTGTLSRAGTYSGSALMLLDYEAGHELVERSLQIAQEANMAFEVGSAYVNMCQMLIELFRFDEAERYLVEGLEYTSEHEDDYHLHWMEAWQAMTRFYAGDWLAAEQIAGALLQRPHLVMQNREYALISLGHLYVRRGDAAAASILEEVLQLSNRAGAIVPLVMTRAARAEAAWLAGDSDAALREARAVYATAEGKGHPWLAGELAFWRRRAGDNFAAPTWLATPYARMIAGDWRGAAREWEQRGCPYEQALCLMGGDEVARLAALKIFDGLGARPAADLLRQELRARGTRGIPRGPRPTTRENPYGLTAREIEVLSAIARGLSNSAIAAELSLSIRTVEHHVASILQKLQAQSRSEAVALALRDDLLLRQ